MGIGVRRGEQVVSAVSFEQVTEGEWMDRQQGQNATGDLERELREAEEAQAEAEAAAQRAALARGEAEQAQHRHREEQEARRRVWAQSIVDAYDADLGAAESAYRDAGERFAETAASNLPEAVGAYLAWAEAGARHFAVQARAAAVAPVLDLEATEPERLSPPPFSDALDAALGRHAAATATRILDETAAEITGQLEAGATRIPISR